MIYEKKLMTLSKILLKHLQYFSLEFASTVKMVFSIVWAKKFNNMNLVRLGMLSQIWTIRNDKRKLVLVKHDKSR